LVRLPDVGEMIGHRGDGLVGVSGEVREGVPLPGEEFGEALS
jgi:hypothetical protein